MTNNHPADTNVKFHSFKTTTNFISGFIGLQEELVHLQRIHCIELDDVNTSLVTECNFEKMFYTIRNGLYVHTGCLVASSNLLYFKDHSSKSWDLCDDEILHAYSEYLLLKASEGAET